MAWRALEKAGGRLTEEETMSLLADTAQGNTIWSVVYSLADGGIQVAVGGRFSTIHSFAMAD